MASGYGAMELQAQVELMRQENTAATAVTAKAQMWKAAQSELGQAGESMGKATDAIEPNWTDQAGTKFVGNTRNAKSVVDTWVRNIETSKPDAALDAVAKGIGDTFKVVQENQQKAQQALAAAQAAAPGGNAAALKEQIEKPFREANGQAMDQLDTLWDAAASAVQGAAGGAGGQQQALSSAGGGGGAGGGGAGGGAGGPGAGGGAQGQQGAGQQGAGAGAQQGAGAENGAATQDPSLSGGLGAAPAAPPSVPPAATPTVPPSVPPTIPPTIPPTVPPGAGVVPGTGVSPGRVGAIPGVVGPGASTIPAAAAPISGPVVPTAGAAPTTTPAAATPPTSGTAVGGGAIPPMVPPMGAAGAGMGGRTGGAGSGAVTRPGQARRRDGRTPGLPAVLSGKAGKANPDAFTVRRREAAAESDIPTTVQLIDEDLWRVEQAPAMDQPPRRTR